jgi:hypothetical protein
VLLLSSLPALAQYMDSGQKLALARQIVAELITDVRIDQISDSYLPALIAPLRAEGLKISPAAEIGIKQVMRDEMHNVIDQSLGDLANAYVATFSGEDLATLVKFYDSDLGKKLLVTEPKLMGNFLPEVEARVLADMPALRSKFQAVFASLPAADK